MQTVMTSNNAYDTILLVDENDVVISAWQADRATIDAYAATGGNADDWQAGEWPRDFDPDMQGDELAAQLRTIAAYGDEVGRNGQMSAERREFWFRA